MSECRCLPCYVKRPHLSIKSMFDFCKLHNHRQWMPRVLSPHVGFVTSALQQKSPMRKGQWGNWEQRSKRQETDRGRYTSDAVFLSTDLLWRVLLLVALSKTICLADVGWWSSARTKASQRCCWSLFGKSDPSMFLREPGWLQLQHIRDEQLSCPFFYHLHSIFISLGCFV